MLYYWIKYISICNEYVIKNLRKLYVYFSLHNLYLNMKWIVFIFNMILRIICINLNEFFFLNKIHFLFSNFQFKFKYLQYSIFCKINRYLFQSVKFIFSISIFSIQYINFINIYTFNYNLLTYITKKFNKINDLLIN